MLKKISVVMLPTKEKAPVIGTLYANNYSELEIANQAFIGRYKFHKEIAKDFIPKVLQYELYFISDEEIKEGDWYIDDCNEIRQAVTSDKEYWKARTDYKKIIATTDGSLICGQDRFLKDYKALLPQPSQSFIQKFIKQYNKGNIINEVMVEGDYRIAIRKDECPFYKQPENGNYMTDDEHGWEILYPENAIRFEDFRLKVNPKDNTITIKPVKDSWTREEVIALHKANCERLTNSYISSDIDWIAENL